MDGATSTTRSEGLTPDMSGVFVERGHLGGYVTGGDEATFFPDLWRYLVEVEEVKSVLDVGCGEGHALRCFRDMGCNVLGVDGVTQPDPDIVTHDFVQGSLVLNEDYDLVWSCEFVEHVRERYMSNFLRTFRAARLALITHADPGQAGYHHVNCRTRDYWLGAMAANGFWFDERLTQESREMAALNTSPWNHFVRSGLAFRAEK